MSNDVVTATGTYRIRWNKSSVHIEGLSAATLGGGKDMGSHVSYAAESHCSALTRGAVRMGFITETVEIRHEQDATVAPGRVRRTQVVADFATIESAVEAARAYADRNRVKFCTKCQEAAALAAN